MGGKTTCEESRRADFLDIFEYRRLDEGNDLGGVDVRRQMVL